MSISFSVAADIATNEACPVPTGICSTCQRSGLPILPLRAAYAPQPWKTRLLPLTRGSEVEAVPMHLDQPRILRQGYLYVLLDRREWQAYEISPEGALSQFRPYQMPREEPRPLCEACIREDHDMPAAFINIDTRKYSTAWLAIANDPWPKAVLDSYLRGGAVDGVNLDERFHRLDLKAARNDPASVGIAMSENDPQLQQVLEYAQNIPGDFRSVHGFYGRQHRLRALKGHLRNMIQKHELANGVLALVLPDPIGMVQELNAQRLIRHQAMQQWCAEPQRSFKYFTSQALLAIRGHQLEMAKFQAEQRVKDEDRSRRERNNNPMFNPDLPMLDVEAETARLASIRQAKARKRLEERYNEQARATFEANYQHTLTGWQRVIDDVAEHYERQYQGAAYQRAALHDYSVTDQRSTALFIRMMQTCLAGGPTERSVDGPPGPTLRLWKTLMENRDSLLYQALTARNRSLFGELHDALAGDEFTRVYHGIKTFITTQQAKDLMTGPVQDAIGQLLSAGATASSRLGNQLSENTRALLGYLHRGALLRYYGVEVTRITVSLKVGEYLSLLNEVLQESTDRFMARLDQQFRKPAQRKVRAMLLSNTLSAAVPGTPGKLVEVTLWTMESADALKTRLNKLSAGVGDGIGDALRTVTIGAEALQGSMGNLARHVTLNADVSAQLARESMRNMRNAAVAGAPGASTMGLGLISLWFQQDSLRRSYENLLDTVGDKHPEAAAAVMSASIGVMGASVEVVGGVIQMVRPDLTMPIGTAGKTVGVGARIVQYGGALVALASAFEGLQYAFAAIRSNASGDRGASVKYSLATASAAGSAVLGVWGSLAPAAFALFPLAASVLLGLAALGLAVWAKRQESQPLELWARHSLWGVPTKHRRWTTPEDLDTAVGVLNAALLGLTANAGMIVKAEQEGGLPIGDAVPAGLFLDYKLVLPGYKADVSGYEWALQVYRPNQVLGETVASGRSGGTNGPLPPPPTWKNPGYRPETTTPVITHNAQTLEISGSISFFGYLEVYAFELQLSYWPDRSDDSGFARLIVKEDKIKGQARLGFV
ncbi:T6SS effector BTH_I2691 family protein [Pseudomonas sp. Irchel 3E13]|uniref:T6SS effector BTH_I2691 family protein n=1 Tax=Pseudomonas sp. Irchel 3E13 TaxID=2008975 RepID=UPI000BA3CF39|nr:T6SS effector BTH_I2691 family protein [Pseudomonas sp. Irchel 3E13]